MVSQDVPPEFALCPCTAVVWWARLGVVALRKRGDPPGRCEERGWGGEPGGLTVRTGSGRLGVLPGRTRGKRAEGAGDEARSARQHRGHRGTGGSLSRPTDTVGCTHARKGSTLTRMHRRRMRRRVWKTKQRHRPGGSNSQPRPGWTWPTRSRRAARVTDTATTGIAGRRAHVRGPARRCRIWWRV